LIVDQVDRSWVVDLQPVTVSENMNQRGGKKERGHGKGRSPKWVMSTQDPQSQQANNRPCQSARSAA
jgi:hypothetical protein